MVTADIEETVQQFLHSLKKSKFEHSNEMACETVRLLEKVATNSEWEAAKDLLDIIRDTGKRLTDAQPNNTVISNMIKRVMKIIRDEYNSAIGRVDECDKPASLYNSYIDKIDFAQKFDALKKSIAANLRELMEELERSPQDIAGQALDHIHFDEVIMTFGYSRTVEKFLKKAASKRKCQVVIAEAAPLLTGHTLAKNLAESGIQTTLIQDSAIFVIMSRVNKVIVGTHSVFAHGGIKATCGVHTMAQAAQYHSVPFLVLAPVYKLTPEYTFVDTGDFNHMMSPESIMSFTDDEILSNVEIISPAYDYVPPELITFFISNSGGNSPSYVYRLLSELYHRDDSDFLRLD